NWSYSTTGLAGQLASGDTYTVQIQATDATTSGNTSGNLAAGTFVYDTAAPSTASLTSNGAYNAAGLPASLTGTTTDSGTGGHGISAVNISIQDSSTGKCWNGTNFSTATCPNYAAVTSGGTAAGTANANWSYATTGMAAQLVQGATYTVQIQATDATTSGNTSGNLTAGSFTYDNLAPNTATLTSNGAYNAAGLPASLTGTTTDSGRGGNGISAVNISIQDSTSGKCWNGTNFTTAACPNYVAVTSGGTAAGSANANWSYATAGLAGQLANGDTYTVQIQATDATTSGNTSGNLAVGSFTYDTTPPTNAITIGSATGAFLSGSTLYYKGNATGNFVFKDALTDSFSGPKNVDYPAIATTGWTHNTETASTSPSYASSTLSWTASPASPSGYSITGRDNAGNTASAPITFTSDTTAATTTVQFPQNNLSYTNTTWDSGSGTCTSTPASSICGTVADTGSGVAQVQVSVLDTNTAQYYDGTNAAGHFGNVSETFLTATLSGGNWNLPLGHLALTSGHTYTVHVKSTDNVGNVETQQSLSFILSNDTTPPATTITLGSASAAFITSTSANHYTVFFDPAGASFKLHDHATDASGVVSEAFPTASGGTNFSGSGITNTQAASSPYDSDSNTYTATATATAPSDATIVSTDGVLPSGNQQSDVIHFVADSSGPTGGALATPAYSSSTSVTVTASPFSDSVDGLASGSNHIVRYTASPSSPGVCPLGTLSGAVPVNYSSASTISTTGNGLTDTGAVDGLCNLYVLSATDNVGHLSTLTSTTLVDTTGPAAPAVTFTSLSSGNTFDNGSHTLYFRPSSSASWTVHASATDAQSGILSGNAGYTFTEPGTQSAGDLTNNSESAGPFTVFATNRTGANSPTTPYTITADSTAPTGGALTVNGTAATTGISGSFLNAGTTVTIARTDYTDAGSGIDGTHGTSLLTYQVGTLAGNVCGTFGVATTIVGTTSPTLTSPNCYEFKLTGTDNVGNVATSLSTIVKVDTSAPTNTIAAPTAVSNASGQHWDSADSVLFVRPATTGSFKLETTAADPDTLVSGVAFPDVSATTGWSGSTGGAGVNTAGSNWESPTYTFGATAVNPSNPLAVVATNNAGLTASAAISIVTDSTAPTGGTITVNGSTVSDGGLNNTTTYDGTGAFTISGRTDYAETADATHSGLASSTLTVQVGNLAGNACSNLGTANDGTTNGSTTISGTTLPALHSPFCYLFTLTGTDNVDNAASIATTVKVDTSGPAGDSVSYANGPTSLTSVSLTWDRGTESDTAVATITIKRDQASFDGSTCGSFSGVFSTITGPTDPNSVALPFVDGSISPAHCYRYQIVSTNVAGVSTTFTDTADTVEDTDDTDIVVHSSTPSGATYIKHNTVYVKGTPLFDLALTTLGQASVDRSGVTWSGRNTTNLVSAPTTDDTTTTAPYTSDPYQWHGPGPDTIVMTRHTGSETLAVVADNTGPTGGGLSYGPGPYTTPSVGPISTTLGTDSGSGISSGTLLRAEGTFDGATCGTIGGFTTAVTLVGAADTTVTGPHCYQYEYVVTDNVGNETTYGPGPVVQVLDLTPPTFVSATTDDAPNLTVHMSKPLAACPTTPPSAFAVTYNGVLVTPTSVTCGPGTDIVLGMPSPGPNNSQSVQVKYTEPGTPADRVTDRNSPGVPAADFGPVSVTNNTTDTVPPVPTSAAVTANSLTILFDQTLGASTPPGSCFDVEVDGHPVTVTGVALAGDTATLTLIAPVVGLQSVTVHYSTTGCSPLLEDASPHHNDVVDFTLSVTNQSSVPLPPSTPASVAPAFVSSNPDDGSTIASAAQLTLNANESVDWVNIQVTLPDGTVAALVQKTGQSVTWPFATNVPGLYVITGSLEVTGFSTPLLAHFTIWIPPAIPGPDTPVVQKNGFPTVASHVTSSDGQTQFSWPQGTWGDAVVVQIAPQPPEAVASLPSTATIVDVTAFILSNHNPVHTLGTIAEVTFKNAPAGQIPLTSNDGKTWRELAQLAGTTLPDGQADGWYRDSADTIHILVRHLTYFAIVPPSWGTKLAIRILTAHRLWLHDRTFMSVRVRLTMPARITGWFVNEGTHQKVPGITIRTPTRRAGVTVLRVALPSSLRSGLYKLQLHVDAEDQQAGRTARLNFFADRPLTPVIPGVYPYGVVVVRGANIRNVAGLPGALGNGFQVRQEMPAVLFEKVDPRTTNTVAMVVDLDHYSISQVSLIHAVLPELRIVAVTVRPRAHPLWWYEGAGISVVLGKGTTGNDVARALRSVLPTPVAPAGFRR
ncbi:MAG: SwmB domain-containing protein, partial [Gaiellaceae bacterium]